MSGGKFQWYGGVMMGRRVRRRKRPLTEKQTFSDKDIDLWIEWLKRLKSGGDLHSAGRRIVYLDIGEVMEVKNEQE